MYLLNFIIFLPYIINQSNLKLVFLLKSFKIFKLIFIYSFDLKNPEIIVKIKLLIINFF
jgi:hypothetical protein